VSNDFIFDVETMANCFTLAVEHAEAPFRWSFEISDYRNQSAEIIAFLRYLQQSNARMVGFNNIGFDYPILHTMVQMGNADAATLYAKAQSIIGAQESEDRWVHQVYPSDRMIPQIDLYKIHHFDNKARATGLKVLEFNMRSHTISDLPFDHGSVLTPDQIVVLKEYNAHDVAQTKEFYHETLPMIRFREELCVKYPEKDWINFNDTKIGKEYFQMELERAGVQCYEYGANGRQPRQTPRPVIHLKDAILPWIEFRTPEFQRILNWFKQQSITETKGVFKDVVATVNGFDYVFGLGGIHGSVENRIIESDDGWVVVDLDVASYYPNLAIKNRLYPEHLGQGFCDIYAHLYEQRKNYAKGTAENAMLKLALNGVYGDSNNRFSVFYDPLFTMSITLNGQLLLCLLAEMVMQIPTVEVIQCNTDGMTIRVKRSSYDYVLPLLDIWQNKTGLTLERVIYRRMFVADVNSYLAESEDGKVKRKGRYEYELDWHQNASALVIPKVAEKVLLEGAPIRETVEQWPDLMDFMLRTKVPRSSHLLWGDERVQNVTRYYIAKDGRPLTKVMPPLKGKTEWRRIGVESGWNVQVCNDIRDATLPVDFDYYIREVEKIVLCLR